MAITITPKINVMITAGDVIPNVLILLNANKMRPKPKVEYTTEILSKAVSLESYGFQRRSNQSQRQ